MICVFLKLNGFYNRVAKFGADVLYYTYSTFGSGLFLISWLVMIV